MDLYFQIGVLFMIAVGFSLIAHAYSDSIDRAENFAEESRLVTKSSIGEAYYGAQILTVDSRSLYSWASNMSKNRDVYLANITGLTVPDEVVDNYGIPLTVNIAGDNRIEREIIVHKEHEGKLPNAVKLKETSSILNKYIHDYAATARSNLTTGVLTVYVLNTEDNNGEAIYLVVAQP